MINETLYHKTIGILVKAYLNDTLEHGNYCGCAAGNMIADSMKINIGRVKDVDANRVRWNGELDEAEHWYTALKPNAGFVGNAEIGLKQIDSTGYTLGQIGIIERAFESPAYKRSGGDEDRMYRGLMAVVEVLGQIHECDKETIEESKLMFVKC